MPVDPVLLRARALALLQDAEAIDGMKPYLIVHSHEYGESVYVGWGSKKPDETAAARLLDAEFEPDRGETIEIHDDLTLSELTGTAPASLIDCSLECSVA